MTTEKIKEFDNQLENFLIEIIEDLNQNESNMTFEQKRFSRLTILNISNTRKQMFMDFHGWIWKDIETSTLEEQPTKKPEEPLTL